MNILLVPMAGKGQRFVDKGFKMPKPLIMVDNRHIIDYSFESVDWKKFDKIIFVVRQDHISNFAIDEILKQKFGHNIEIVVTDGITRGSVCSCLLAKNLINTDDSLTVYCLDVNFLPIFDVQKIPLDVDGCILTFKANSTAYSYVKTDNNNLAIKTAEKQTISENASVGIYYFKSGKQFVKYAEEMIMRGMTTNNEYYICPLYNLMIEDGLKISTSQVDKIYIMGTPEELDFFIRNIRPKLNFVKPIALCADHSGFKLKEDVKKILHELGQKYIDFGTYTSKDCDYNDYVSGAISHIHHGICDFGIGCCRSGQGVNICANKFKGIRSALVFDEYTATYAIRHNCCNFFSLPEKYLTPEMTKHIITSMINQTFDGGRHISRVQKTENAQV